jgi:hypothetical protein
MRRRFWDRFRQIAPEQGTVIAFFILFVAFEGFIRYLESLGIPIGSRLAVRPAAALLFLSSAAYGIARVTGFHPVFQKDYRIWLESTPWQNRKPLPFGPVELVPEDALVLVPLSLRSCILPQPRAMSLLAAFLLCNLSALVVSFWLTRTRVVGYLSAFGLGLAVRLWHQPPQCVAMAALVYLVAYEGLVQALDRFPWAPRRISSRVNTEVSTLVSPPREPCGWPHDRMLGEIVGAAGLSRIDAVLGCALGGWWLYVMASFIEDERNRTGFLLVASLILGYLFSLLRLVLYVQGYQSPLSIWGRIRTLRLIIPGYDQVFAAPLLSLIAGPAALGLLYACRRPMDACIPIGTRVSAAVALVVPPRLRQWRLTGEHRIVSGITGSDTVFVKVG